MKPLMRCQVNFRHAPFPNFLLDQIGAKLFAQQQIILLVVSLVHG
jgi:hypothetical protein